MGCGRQRAMISVPNFPAALHDLPRCQKLQLQLQLMTRVPFAPQKHPLRSKPRVLCGI
jgi:hypothetical protein